MLSKSWLLSVGWWAREVLFQWHHLCRQFYYFHLLIVKLPVSIDTCNSNNDNQMSTPQWTVLSYYNNLLRIILVYYLLVEVKENVTISNYYFDPHNMLVLFSCKKRNPYIDAVTSLRQDKNVVRFLFVLFYL